MKLNGKFPEDYLKSYPKDKIKTTLALILNVMMVIEFICAISIYIVLKTYASLQYAELWMLIMYAWVLKSNINMFEEHTLKSLEDSNENNTKKADNTQSKNIEECNDKD